MERPIYKCVAVWDTEYYLVEDKQFSDTSTSVEVKKYNDKLPSQLTEKSNSFLNDYTTTSW